MPAKDDLSRRDLVLLCQLRDGGVSQYGPVPYRHGQHCLSGRSTTSAAWLLTRRGISSKDDALLVAEVLEFLLNQVRVHPASRTYMVKLTIPDDTT